MISGFLEGIVNTNLFPYILLSAGAVFVLMCAITLKSSRSRAFLGFCTFFTILGALISLFVISSWNVPYSDLLIHDSIGTGFGAVILLLLLFVIPVLPVGKPTLNETPSGVFSLLILSAMGALLMVYANHFLVFFVGLELLSLPLYVLVGLGKDQRKGTEAAFKYFLLGAISSSLFIYGVALLWGALGTMTISNLMEAYALRGSSYPGLVLFGSTLVLSGIGFKLGLVPFHMWVPDVYEGSPCTIVAWMSGAVKAAILALGLRLCGEFLPMTDFDWSGALTVIAVLSMIIGSFGALYQRNVKRLLAYSAIAHAGYATIGLITASNGAMWESSAALIFYILTYGIASMGAFIILSVEEAESELTIADLAGLARRRPGLALALATFMLSLAGMPPLGGFIGKFNLLKIAVDQQLFGLVLFAVMTSVVSLGYYLSIIVSIYMKEPSTLAPIRVRFGTFAAMSICALVTLLLGVLPGGVLSYLFEVGQQTIR